LRAKEEESEGGVEVGEGEGVLGGVAVKGKKVAARIDDTDWMWLDTGVQT
jgi:hypothetical protein